MIDQLQSQLEDRFGRSFDAPWEPLTGGYESDVYRVGELVVRVSPAWRTDAELLWTHDLTRHCARTIPQVVAPLAARDGRTLFRWDDRPVTVYPYVAGEPLDWSKPALLEQAGTLLARIHNAGLCWPNRRPRPSASTAAPSIPDALPDPPEIVDPDLDRWFETVFAQQDHVTGPVHGDYYRANLLCADKLILGIIDWDESEVRPLITETAWAMWEFAHDAGHFDYNRAQPFLWAYWLERGQTRSMRSRDTLSLFQVIRRHLRYEIRRSLAAEARGEGVDLRYRDNQIDAFNNLRQMQFDW
jgi:Ser/Thr protein kinase RdoA (MazF antagonist)